jgi:hypothetical protein
MGRPHKTLPQQIVTSLPHSLLCLPADEYLLMRCGSANGHACARCIKALRKPTALRYAREGRLPPYPAHRLKPERGCAELVSICEQTAECDWFVHQVPVFSQGRGGSRWGRNACSGKYSKGRDSAVDVVVVTVQQHTWVTIALEIDGSEHDRATAAKPDAKRISSARAHSKLHVLRLRLAEQACWRRQLVCFRDLMIEQMSCALGISWGRTAPRRSGGSLPRRRLLPPYG